MAQSIQLSPLKIKVGPCLTTKKLKGLVKKIQLKKKILIMIYGDNLN